MNEVYQIPLNYSSNEYLCQVYENQRYIWLSGWGIDFLPDDPGPFTYAFDNNQETVTLDSLEAITCPNGWKWDSEWEINRTYTNMNSAGWSYSTSFIRMKIKLDQQISSSNPTPRQVTRRRLWNRKMIREGNTKIDDKYRVTSEELGSGAYAVVKLAYSKSDGTKYAIKCIDLRDPDPTRSKEIEEDTLNEISILRTLNHSHIVKLYDVYRIPSMIYLVLEYISGGELFDKIIEKQFYTEDEARNTIRILISTISYLHEQSIVHRDLKPENILLLDKSDSSLITISDFGFAKCCPKYEESLHDFCGSPNYIAPEILRNELYGQLVDMWSIGVISYILLAGYAPFYHENESQQFKMIMKGDYEFHDDAWGGVSDIAKDFIKTLLQVNPINRSTAEKALEHPWLTVEDERLRSNTLSVTLVNLRKFQALRKFRVTATAVVAAKKFKKFSQNSTNQSTLTTPSQSLPPPPPPPQTTTTSTITSNQSQQTNSPYYLDPNDIPLETDV